MKSFSCCFARCNSSYQRKEHLQRHLSQHALNGRKVPCPFCDRSFSRHDLMRRHARQAHPNLEPPRLCEIRGGRARPACRAGQLSSTTSVRKDPSGRPPYKQDDCLPPNHPLQSKGPSPDSTSKVLYYTQRYFQYFHPQWPFLHQSTYTIEREPPLLVYSVVVMGLWIDGTAASRAAALALHTKLGEYIMQQQSRWDGTSLQRHRDSPPESTCPVATYQAIILHLIFAAQRALQIPLSHTHCDILLALVQVCRRQNLFFYHSMIHRYGAITSTACIWVGVEEIKRLGIALRSVCELYRDTFIGTIDTSGLLTWADLHFPVPDSDELWNAKSNASLGQRLAELTPDAALDGRCEENWISRLDGQTSCA